MDFDITKRRTSIDGGSRGGSRRSSVELARGGSDQVMAELDKALSSRTPRSNPLDDIKPEKGGGARGSDTADARGGADTKKKKKEPEIKKPVKYEKKELTKDEIKKLLTGYMSVPKKYWTEFNRGDSIHWIDTDGNFHKGGYVKFTFDKDGTHHIATESVLGGKAGDKFYTSRTATVNTTAVIYKKTSIEYYMLVETFGNKIAELQKQLKH